VLSCKRRGLDAARPALLRTHGGVGTAGPTSECITMSDFPTRANDKVALAELLGLVVSICRGKRSRLEDERKFCEADEGLQ
jgi:hypothetical protein